MASKNRTLRLPIDCDALFHNWPEPLQPNGVYLRGDGLELVVGSEDDVFALVGVHIPTHPRDIPSTRLIRSNLDGETQPLLHQRMNALVALWPSEALENLRTTRAHLHNFEEKLSAGLSWEVILTDHMNAEHVDSVLAPTRLLEHLAAGRMNDALNVWSAGLPSSPTPASTAVDFATACTLILRGHGQDAFRMLETLHGRRSVTAHRGWTRIALHLDATEQARKHWAQSLSRDDVRDVIGLAEVTLDCGREDAALSLARTAQEMLPDSPELLTRLADVLLHCGDLDGAIALLVGAQSDDMTCRAAEMALYGCRSQQARELLATTSKTSTVIERAKGVALVLDGDYDEALRVLSPLTGDVEADFWLAEAYVRCGRLDDALQVLNRAKHAMGEHPVERLLLGAIAIPKTWRKSDHKHRSILAALLGTTPEFESLSDEEEQTLILDTLRKLGGNRGEKLTIVDDDGLLRSMRHVVSPRTRAIRTQHAIRSRSIDWVQGQFVAHQRAEPDIPFWRTYSAELDLWQGDYDEAHEHFRNSWDDEEETRWMYVGLGATLTMMGRHDEALTIFEEGISKLGAMSPGEATWAYRGEIALHRGDMETALNDLEHAVSLRPSRVGTRLVLALTYLRLGRLDEAVRLVDQSSPAADILFWEAHRALGLEARTTPSSHDLEAVLQCSLDLLVGNRSSYLLTFRAHGGGPWHVHPIEGHSQECRALASRLIPLAYEDIASRLLSEELRPA